VASKESEHIILNLALGRFRSMPQSTQPITGATPHRRRIASSIAWNYAGHFYQICINLGLTAYVVRIIAVPEYGLLLFVMSLSATLNILDMGISSVLVQTYVEAAGSANKHRLNDLISTAFLTLAGLGFIGAIALSALSLLLPGPFNIPHQYVHEASLVFVIAALVLQISLPSIAVEQVYQASHRFDRINQIRLVVSTLQLVLTLAVLAAGLRIVGLALVQLCSTALELLLLSAMLPFNVPGARLSLRRFRWGLLGPLINLSKWALLNNILASFFDLAVWIILGSLGSMKEAAMFGLAGKLPKQLWNLVDKGAIVALPAMSKSALEGDPASLQQTFLKSQKLVVGAILPFIVLGAVFARPLIQVWAGSAYTDAAVVMKWLLLAALAHAVLYSSDLLLYACSQIQKAAWISFAGGVVSVAGATLLVSRYGAAGMASALAITQIFFGGGWFTLEACRLSHTPPGLFLRTVANGLAWPVFVMVAETALICSVWRFLSPPWLVVAAVLSGCVYLGIWSWQTALPLYHGHTEIVG
jgi:O-antigen/teichoic acid export membrane protein